MIYFPCNSLNKMTVLLMLVMVVVCINLTDDCENETQSNLYDILPPDD